MFSLCLGASALLEGTLPQCYAQGIDLRGQEVYIAKLLCAATSKSTLALASVTFTVSSFPSSSEIPH